MDKIFLIDKILDPLLRYILPGECPGCGRTPSARGLCPDCIRHIISVSGIHRHALYPLSDCVSCVEFKGQARRALIMLKYSNMRGILPLIPDIIAPSLREIRSATHENTVLVPIPGHPHRTLKRGNDHTLLIANVISRMSGIPVKTNMIKRNTRLPSQTLLSRQDRCENTRHMFRACSGHIAEKKHIILVDDVITTGATMKAAGEILKISGAAGIAGIAVAGTPSPEGINFSYGYNIPRRA